MRYLRDMSDTLKAVARSIAREIRVYRLILTDNRAPRLAKVLLGLALGYAALPFDLIPDFIPVLSHLDDLIVVPALVIVALNMVPREVVEDCRSRSGGA